MKKAFNWLCRIFIVVALVIVACMIFSRVMDIKIHELYERNPVGVNHISGVGQKDKGSILLNETLQDDQNILVMASSELGSPVPENIKKLFPNDQYDGDISCVGHGHVQNLVHAINLGSNYDIVRDNNIVVIEGLQWFMGEEQDIDGFFSNFSEKQFYDFLCNDNISRESKKYLCNRYIDLERDHLAYFLRTMDESGVAGSAFRYFKHIFPDDSILVGDFAYPSTYILARTYVSDNPVVKAMYYVLKPYYSARDQIMTLKDKYDAYKWLSENNTVSRKKRINKFTWDELYSTGEEEGKEACTNNKLYVYDDYYSSYLADKWEGLKGNYADISLMTSREWDDYEFFLKLCRELGLKPYVVLESTNGRYYDYAGIEKQKRDELYDRQEKMAEEYGIDALNLKDYEYEPYFYCDVMHLGWKGWPYVTQQIVEHFSK